MLRMAIIQDPHVERAGQVVILPVEDPQRMLTRHPEVIPEIILFRMVILIIPDRGAIRPGIHPASIIPVIHPALQGVTVQNLTVRQAGHNPITRHRREAVATLTHLHHVNHTMHLLGLIALRVTVHRREATVHHPQVVRLEEVRVHLHLQEVQDRLHSLTVKI